MGRWLAPAAAWIGPVLVIRYARDHGAGRGFALIFVALTVAFLIGFGARARLHRLVLRRRSADGP